MFLLKKILQYKSGWLVHSLGWCGKQYVKALESERDKCPIDTLKDDDDASLDILPTFKDRQRIDYFFEGRRRSAHKKSWTLLPRAYILCACVRLRVRKDMNHSGD